MFSLVDIKFEQNDHHWLPKFSNAILWQKLFVFSISLTFLPGGSFSNKSALVGVMTWRLTGHMLLLQAVMIRFTYAYVHQLISVS